MIDKFAFALENKSNGGLRASRHTLIELMQVCTKDIDFEKSFLVLDGLDECKDIDGFVKTMLKMALGTHIKTLVFSRQAISMLSRTVPESRQLSMGMSATPYIRTFLSRNIRLLVEEDLLQQNISVTKLTKHLLRGADGMFLWARLMVNYLSSEALSRQQRLEAIQHVTMPEGLEEMYMRIITIIGLKCSADQRLAKWIIQWLTMGVRNIASEELQEAWRVNDPKIRANLDRLSNFDRTVLSSCASLVESTTVRDVVSGALVPGFRLIHLSARDFFLQPNGPWRSTAFRFEIQTSEIDISRACLQYLLYCTPAQPLGSHVGSRASPEKLHTAFAFHNYASLNWVRHLTNTTPDALLDIEDKNPYTNLFPVLTSFIGQKFVLTSWIEAYFTFSNPPGASELRDLCSWATSVKKAFRDLSQETKGALDDVDDFGRYLIGLNDDWGSKLLKSPEIIWEEVTAFTPSRLLPQSTTTQVDILVEDALSDPKLSTRCLSKISETTSDGLMVGTLSIWPSR
jgi:hypothetical protein